MRPSNTRYVGLIIAWMLVFFPVGEAVGDDPIPRWESRLLKRYERKVLDLLADATTGCIDCHSSDSMSNLVLSGRALQDFRHLLDNGYLNRQGPDTLLGRVTSTNPDRRMPKDGDPWTKAQVRRLERLVDHIARLQVATGVAADERFPRSLLVEADTIAAGRPPTQFLSYRQLKSKIRAIFDDDWVRGGRDLFAENLPAFGGADFKTRFNESTEPTAGYLSALEALSRDVAGRAYRARTGPFEDWSETDDGSLDSLHKGIDTIYQRILLRAPSAKELAAAVELVRGIGQLTETVSQRDTELVFEVVVTDPETSLSGTQTITIPVRGDQMGVRQTILDQRPPRLGPDRWLESAVTRIADRIAARVFGDGIDSMRGRKSLGRVRLGPQHSGRVVIHNEGTKRNVSFAGIEIYSHDGRKLQTLGPDSPQVVAEGAWSDQSRDGLQSLEDDNQHKGMSLITVSFTAQQDGQYEIFARWRPSFDNANNVLAELYGVGVADRLQPSQTPIDRIQGNPRFYYDCGDDSIPFVELPASFQFGSQDFVEISNAGTYRRVTAGAIDMINAADASNNFLIDSKIAQGADDWQSYNAGQFGSYNVRGAKLHDNNQRKGQLSLRYQLGDRVDHGWRQDQFYKVRIYYPGKRNHEPEVPVTVFAQRSSPMVRLKHPLIAKSDATVRLDASSSFTVQASPLEFQWRQVAGPRVSVIDWTAPAIEFVAPRQSARELAWVSLCGALMRHPDFLFTQPPGQEADDDGEKRKMLLSKIAMDLVGRPPSRQEFDRLKSGASLQESAQHYLQSDEFTDYYFHRIRLYLESQGSITQDEPARLWTYVALNDRPFQEILTADYTVDKDFNQVQRPDYHGRTGVLTTKGFIEGKPGLPHYNYAAQVSMLFLGYVYEVPPEIVEQREGITALGTADPNSTCYSCHKILTPLAFQRLNWNDAGEFRVKNEDGIEIDASDRGVVDEYPFKGVGLDAFAMQAVKKERFIRTMINTHVNFYFGRPMRYLDDERGLYKRLWDNVHENKFQIRSLIEAIVTSPEYLGQISTGLETSNESVPR